MGANDSPTTTRSVVTDYFDWRLNQKTPTNNRLFVLVRRIASECEQAYRAQQPTINFCSSLLSSSSIDIQTLNNIKSIHYEIAHEIFADNSITWTRIITFISFSALLAEQIIQQHPNDPSANMIISSVVDWTTNFIDHDLQTWLQTQNYWVRTPLSLFLCFIIIFFFKAGCQKLYDKTPQRRNSISRYAGILGTIGKQKDIHSNRTGGMRSMC